LSKRCLQRDDFHDLPHLRITYTSTAVRMDNYKYGSFSFASQILVFCHLGCAKLGGVSVSK